MNWTKKALKSTLTAYKIELKKLNEYESEFELRLKLAAMYGEKVGKIASSLAELIVAQTEYVNSLKVDAERLYFRLSAQLKNSAKKIAA